MVTNAKDCAALGGKFNGGGGSIFNATASFANGPCNWATNLGLSAGLPIPVSGWGGSTNTVVVPLG